MVIALLPTVSGLAKLRSRVALERDDSFGARNGGALAFVEIGVSMHRGGGGGLGTGVIVDA